MKRLSMWEEIDRFTYAKDVTVTIRKKGSLAGDGLRKQTGMRERETLRC